MMIEQRVAKLHNDTHSILKKKQKELYEKYMINYTIADLIGLLVDKFIEKLDIEEVPPYRKKD